MELSSLAVEYVRVPISAKESGSAVDPTGQTVQMAFLAQGTTPSGGDWKTASWETDATTNPDTYYARCLVGSAAVLTAGTFQPWVKIAGPSPETVVVKADGLLTIV